MTRPKRLTRGQRAIGTAASVIVLAPLAVAGAVVITASEIAERCPQPRLLGRLALDHADAWLRRHL